MDCMDKRVQCMEATEQAAEQVTGYGNDSDEITTQSVGPSLEILRNKRRLAELKNVNEMAIRGRIKSQRGGPGDVTVKKLVDWPQDFILTGAHKTRPTYAQLLE